MTRPAPDDRTPVEVAVDLLVHAPLGVLVLAREELPKLIAKGRQEATGARFIGKMAVDMGQREAGRLVRQATERLADLGLVPDPRRSAPGPSAADDAGTPGAAATHAESDGAPDDVGSDPADVGGAQAPAGGGGTRAPAGGDGVMEADPAPVEGPAAGSLAIPGYDALSAPQVVQRLDGLADEELEAVRAYEAGNRGRKTILSRIAQIQSRH